MTPNSRSYLNHFTQPDSIVPDLHNPQSLNRYSYTLNNPIRYNDPSGHMVAEGDGGGGGCGHSGVYSQNCSGWHEYTTTNVVCPAKLHCTEKEMKDDLLRFAYPGQDPSKPVVSGQSHSVSWPIPDINISMGSLGAIVTDVSKDGFTITNTTKPTHILYDGKVERTISQLPDGSWIVTTHGYGNNVTHNVTIPLRDDLGTIQIPVNFASLNGWGGPLLPGGINIFNGVDQQMLNYVEANH